MSALRSLATLAVALAVPDARAGQPLPLDVAEDGRHLVQRAPEPGPPAASERPPASPAPAGVAIGEGGADGFVTTADDGTLHVIYGGKYRSGPGPDRLGPEEKITDIDSVNGVRMDVDSAGQPHVVFTAGTTSKATRSYYTTRAGGRWLPAEKFADAADFPERERAYVADIAVDARGHALVCFWVGRPNALRKERHNPSFYYRWRTPEGAWSEPRSLAAHWSSAPKVEFAPGRGFFLLWQAQGREWRIAGPVSAGDAFSADQSVSAGSDRLTSLSTQNEGADFNAETDGLFVVAGNVREKFEGPVGVWAAIGRADAPLAATFLGGFAGTKRGQESGVHPVTAFDVATGTAYVVALNPADRRAYVAWHLRQGGWQRGYVPLLPRNPAPQGTLRQGPSVADVPGPGVVALVRDGEERWYLQKIGAPAAVKSAEWNAWGKIEDLGPGITPGVAVSPDGTTHVVYMDGGEILHRQRAPGGRFGAAGRIPLPAGEVSADAEFNSPHPVCDAAGTLHLVFTRGFTGAARKVWYTNYRGDSWRVPVVAIDHSETGRRTNYPRLATDGTLAFIGAFAGGGSTVARLVDLATNPRVERTVDTALWVAHPLLHPGGALLVVGRRGAAGHYCESYSAGLVARGTPVRLSGGTPTKTFEPTAAIIDDSGVIHAAGATGSPVNVLWYTTSARAAAGEDVILGPELGTGIKEYTYPTLVRDVRGRLYVSYRRHPSGEGMLTLFDEESGRFAAPVTFAPAIQRRLRWNAPLGAAPGGGVYAVWESEGRIFFRAIGESADASKPEE